MDSEEAYLKRGTEALKEYNLQIFEKHIDKAISDNSENLHFKGTAKNFKSKLLEFAGISLSETNDTLKFLNRNKYWNKAIDFAVSYAKENPDEVKELVSEIETEMENKLLDMGFNQEFYESLIKKLKKNGIFGKNGGAKLTLDNMFEHSEKVSESLSNMFGDDYLIGSFSIDRLGKLMSEIKMTPSGAREAYKADGMKGVMKYACDNLVFNGAPMLREQLAELDNGNVKFELTPEKIIDYYKQGGFFGKEGVAEKVGMLAYEKFPGSEEFVYYALLGAVMNNKKNKLKQGLEKLHPDEDFRRRSSDLVDEGIEQRIRIVLKEEFPEILKKENLLKIYNENGFFGEKGVFAYLGENRHSIFKNKEIFDGEDMTYFHNIALQFSRAKSYLTMFEAKREKTDNEKYAIAIAKKADKLGITPIELLREPKYIKHKKKVIEEVYSSINNYYVLRYSQIPQAIPIMDNFLAKIKKQEPEKFLEEIMDFRPNSKFFGRAFDMIYEKYAKKTLLDKVEDYVVLARAVMNEWHEFGKNEIKSYESA